MALRKCPKCEVNYIKGDAAYCDICLSAMKRVVKRAPQEETESEPILCTECGEAPAVPGHELCAECLKEQKRQHDLENAVDLPDDEEGDGPLLESDEE